MVKKIVSFTIDEELLEKWKEYVKKNSINSSMLVENLLKKYLKKENFSK